MLILLGTATSPFVRKIRIAASILKLEDSIRFEPAVTFDPASDLCRQNPLGKIPTLVLKDGSTLYDSRVILEYLDHIAGNGQIIPIQPDARFKALRLQALVDGILDAAVLLVQENRFRSAEKREPKWIAHQSERMARALAVLEKTPPETARTVNVGDIALGSALDWLDLRFEQMCSQNYPRLMEWQSEFARRVPNFAETKPH